MDVIILGERTLEQLLGKAPVAWDIRGCDGRCWELNDVAAFGILHHEDQGQRSNGAEQEDVGTDAGQGLVQTME